MKLSKNVKIELQNCRLLSTEPPHQRIGPERVRTADPLLAKQVLYQLSYRPENGGPKRNCTSDPSVISTVLC